MVFLFKRGRAWPEIAEAEEINFTPLSRKCGPSPSLTRPASAPTAQERLLLSILPKHLASEIRQDLGAVVTGQFKKIYMSRHENVR